MILTSQIGTVLSSPPFITIGANDSASCTTNYDGSLVTHYTPGPTIPYTC